MRFTRVRLENWRNFTSVEVGIQRRAFLVGPNASGKSNLLDALRFLHDVASVGGGFQDAVRRRGGLPRLRSLAARRISDVTVSIEIGEGDREGLWAYELRFTQDKRHRPQIARERVVRNGREVSVRPDEKDKADPERMTQTYLEQVHANEEFREIAEFLGSVRYLHLVPQLVREPDRYVRRDDDPFGSGFLDEVAKTPEKTRNARLRRIRDALRVAVPQLAELELDRDVRGRPHLRGKYEHWRPQGAWQSEDQFSDGTLRLLGLLWAALEGTGPLLLEEPELSLHPEVVRFLPQMFARIQRSSGRQILLSTHSTDLLRDQGIGLDEVLLLQPATEGTAVEAAANFKDIRRLLEGGVALGDAVMPRTRPRNAKQLMLFGS
jgi:predicted ATPase